MKFKLLLLQALFLPTFFYGVPSDSASELSQPGTSQEASSSDDHSEFKLKLAESEDKLPPSKIDPQACENETQNQRWTPLQRCCIALTPVYGAAFIVALMLYYDYSLHH